MKAANLLTIWLWRFQNIPSLYFNEQASHYSQPRFKGRGEIALFLSGGMGLAIEGKKFYRHHLEEKLPQWASGVEEIGTERIEPEGLGEASYRVITLSSVRSHGKAEAVAWR